MRLILPGKQTDCNRNPAAAVFANVTILLQYCRGSTKYQ